VLRSLGGQRSPREVSQKPTGELVEFRTILRFKMARLPMNRRRFSAEGRFRLEAIVSCSTVTIVRRRWRYPSIAERANTRPESGGEGRQQKVAGRKVRDCRPILYNGMAAGAVKTSQEGAGATVHMAVFSRGAAPHRDEKWSWRGKTRCCWAAEP